MKHAKDVFREAIVALVAAAIGYAAIGATFTMLGAFSSAFIVSIPFVAGALLPAAYDAREQIGIVHAAGRPALRGAGEARCECSDVVGGPDIVSIAPARRTGPITFEITALRLPVTEPARRPRCTLHKGIIPPDAAVSCKRCGATYCSVCASQLASLGEPCWACHQPMEQ
ncbi:MAG: hypothetical protein JW839_13890 [Candidatus Lokiarchaeota archaeon]|nr:hypothetical protein [Candidatus Lokiarchaeota archaeon]